MAVVPTMRFGTDVGVTDYPDGSILVYVTNAEPVNLRLPKWFKPQDRAALLEAVKECYLASARRVLLEQIGLEKSSE